MQVTLQNGRVISLGIWDTAGAERFQSISRMYYHGSRAAVICFSPGSQQSFAKAKFWVGKETDQGLPEDLVKPAHCVNVAFLTLHVTHAGALLKRLRAQLGFASCLTC